MVKSSSSVGWPVKVSLLLLRRTCNNQFRNALMDHFVVNGGLYLGGSDLLKVMRRVVELQPHPQDTWAIGSRSLFTDNYHVL